MLSQLTLYRSVASSAETWPDRPALLYQGKVIRYRALLKRIDALAAALAGRGVGRGTAVTVCMPNLPECVCALYAINKLGGVAHMVHPLAPPERLAEHMEAAESRLVFLPDLFYETHRGTLAAHGFTAVVSSPAHSLGAVKRAAYGLLHRREAVREPSALTLPYADLERGGRGKPSPTASDASAPAVYLHSGGTSGQPKTIVLSNFAIQSLASNSLYILGVDDLEGRAMFSVLPLFHGFGLCMGVHCMLAFGGCDALIPKFHTRDAVKLFRTGRVQYLIGVPAVYEALLKRPDFSGKAVKGIELAFVGGDFVSHELLERFDRRMAENGSQARLFEGYGLTEVVTVCAVNLPHANRPGTVGRALPGITIKIADASGRELPRGTAGEIFVAGPERMDGYLKDAEATAAVFVPDGRGEIFVRTGDFGSMDEDGYLIFLARIKRIVKVSGINVFPSEIEQLAVRFPGVTGAYAAGVPDEKRGCVIALFLESEGAPDTEGIADEIERRISAYARPVRVSVVKKFPQTAVGKVDPAALLAQAEEKER